VDTDTKIGWIGTGVMGLPMCGHLLRAGYGVSVHSRTASRSQDVLAQGARWCDSPAEVAAASEVIFTMVGTPDEVHAVYFAQDGLLSTDASEKIFVDMGTTAPDLSVRISEAAHAKNARSVDAPVSGGDVGAVNAALSIMAGGDKSTVRTLQPLFDCLGSVRYMGGAGSGQHTKMCNQLTAAGSIIGVCEALVYAEHAGLDLEQLIEAIRPGAAGCWALDNLAPRIIKDDFAPGFMVDHFVKDLGIALQQAESMGLDLPGLALADRLYRQTQAIGHGKSGIHALIHAVRARGKGQEARGEGFE